MSPFIPILPGCNCRRHFKKSIEMIIFVTERFSLYTLSKGMIFLLLHSLTTIIYAPVITCEML